MVNIKVRSFAKEDEKAWDEYVRNSGQASFFHLSGWKNVLEKTFGYKPFYLYVERGGEICGILPLFLMKNLKFKNTLVSIPFGVYGGVCADDDSAAEVLLEEAKRIAKKTNSEYLELKNINPINNGLYVKELYVMFKKELPQNKEDCLKQQPRKARAASRKAIEFGLKAEVGIHLLKECHHIYSVSVRNLGTPVVPFSFFKNIAEEFKDCVTVLSVKFKGKTIASVLTFLFRDTVMPHYGGALPEYFKYHPNNFMYLKLMEWGVENGYKFFDFGRSKKGSGSYKFKELQGFEPKQMHYQYYLNKTKEMPNLNPANPKFSLPITVWKRIPVCITKIIGPRIVKYIGG